MRKAAKIQWVVQCTSAFEKLQPLTCRIFEELHNNSRSCNILLPLNKKPFKKCNKHLKCLIHITFLGNVFINLRAHSSLSKASRYVSWSLPVREQHHTKELHRSTRWQKSLQNKLVSITANLQLHSSSKINCIGLHELLTSCPPIKQVQQLHNFLQDRTSK